MNTILADLALNPQALDGLGTFVQIALGLGVLALIILGILLPFAVWGIYGCVRRCEKMINLIGQDIVKELRRGSVRPPPGRHP